MPFGCHEGSRSEYLAQYVFASWGMAVNVPQQDDVAGIDLFCTLMEQAGKRWLPKSPYTVQVKSELEPLKFEGPAVERVVRHPLPFFLCVVQKAEARLSVYHTFPRFFAWSRGKLPDKLEMVPAPFEPGAKGYYTQWLGDYRLCLDRPILHFTVAEMLNAEFWDNAKRVFEGWVEVENDNLTRVRAGLPTFRMPGSYRTNEGFGPGWVEMWQRDGDFPAAEDHLRACLEWLGERLARRGDIGGAARVALLLRHLHSDGRSIVPPHLLDALDDRLAELLAGGGPSAP